MHSVLIVDDEPLVLRAVERILAHDGYRTFACLGGHAAMAFIASHSANVDAIVTDVMMPDLDGTCVGSAAKAKWPDARLVYMSGYCGTPEQAANVVGDFFLQKPFTRTSLLDALRPVRSRIDLPSADDSVQL